MRLAQTLTFCIYFVQEIYGELGADTLTGGPGNDIIIGDIGHCVRRYDSSGSPIEQFSTLGTLSTRVWHKDIILEELGNITGVDRISQKVNVSTLTADDILSSSLLFVAHAFKEDGNKFLSTEEGGWLTDLIRFDLVPGYNDIMSGGDGDDVIIGQRGDDRINGDDGNDLLIGDAGFNVNPENTDLPRIYQVYRALRDFSDSNYAVEGTSDKEYGVLFTADYELYPHQYREVDSLASIVDMVINADDILQGRNLLKHILGVAGLSTTDSYCMQPMFRVTPGYLHDTQKMHGNDVIDSGRGASIVIGDDIRSYSGVDITDVTYIQGIRLRLDNLVDAFGIRLNTMEVDNELFNGVSVGDYNISVASDEITTNIEGQVLVTGDSLTLMARTIGSGSLVSGFFLFLRTAKLKSIMSRLFDVERALWDLHYCLYELHTDLLKRADATISIDLSGTQEPLHSLSLANDIINSKGNGDISAGDSSVLYFHVDRPGVSRFRFDKLTRLERWAARCRMRSSRRSRESELKRHISNDLKPTSPLSEAFIEALPFEDVPFLLTVATDVINMNNADNLAVGDFAFYGIVMSSRDESNGGLVRYSESIKSLRTKLSIQASSITELAFEIGFYAVRYDEFTAAEVAPTMHGDYFFGSSLNNAMFGEFLTGQTYTQFSEGQSGYRLDTNGNAYSVAATANIDGDTFDVVIGSKVNGQFGDDVILTNTVLTADLTFIVAYQMSDLFYGSPLISTMMRNLFYGTVLDASDATGVGSGFQCTDPAVSSYIPPAADGDIGNSFLVSRRVSAVADDVVSTDSDGEEDPKCSLRGGKRNCP
jgi:Ca2+-binding RTX toxin-like protein